MQFPRNLWWLEKREPFYRIVFFDICLKATVSRYAYLIEENNVPRLAVIIWRLKYTKKSRGDYN